MNVVQALVHLHEEGFALVLEYTDLFLLIDLVLHVPVVSP